MNGRMERELPYTDFDAALLGPMGVELEKPEPAKFSWKGAIWGIGLSSILWVGIIYAWLWRKGML